MAATATLLLTACGGAATERGDAPTVAASPADVVGPSAAPPATGPVPAPTGDATAPSSPGRRDEPPDLVVSSPAETSHRRPYTFCWTTSEVGVCVDGRPSAADRVDVRGTLRLSLPLDDWTLTATRWADLDDPEGPRIPLRPTGSGVWVVEQLPAGRHLLEIAGRGPEGDAFWMVPVTVLDGS